MGTWTEELATLLRSARENRGWSRKRLADEAGVSERTVIDYERLARGDGSAINPRRSTVARVVRALGDHDLARSSGIELRDERALLPEARSDEMLAIVDDVLAQLERLAAMLVERRS
jgi:transcriptional regulator with XRE-family HTH domain